MSTELVTPEEVARAHTDLGDVAVRTPLLGAEWLSARVGGDVRLKCENLQHAGAFKIRGAYTAVSRLTEEQRQKGVIAFSSGNHAQGVALAAQIFGIRAVVVMPTTAPAIKVDGARRLGAEVVIEGTTSVHREAKAREIAADQGLTIIPAFDDINVITGQGTCGVEILEQWPEVEAILVPCGGGGLLSGIAAYVKRVKPDCLVIGVEPEKADAMHRSLAAGELVTIESRPTIADGLMPVRPGALNFEHVRALVDDLVLVPDDAIMEAAASLMKFSKLVVEFSGAATVGALLAGAWKPEGRRTVAVLSGGNMDPARAVSLFSTAQ
ncbi:MAG: threonine/serine dehydratase [Longimicrobiales bacterium]